SSKLGSRERRPARRAWDRGKYVIHVLDLVRGGTCVQARRIVAGVEGRAALLTRATLLASLLVASCTDATPTPSNAPVATETPVRGGQLTLGLSTDITTLQPILSNDTPSASVWSLIY